MEQQTKLLDVLDRLDELNPTKGTIEMRMNTFLDAKAREKGIPLNGTFELTPLCNLDCKMCYVHLSNKQLCESSRTLLSADQWKTIMSEAVDHGMLFALLTGGEAMMHPAFEEIYLYLQSRGVNVSVNTNGLLLTPARIEFFMQHLPKELRITMYGADEDTYERVTGHRVFSRVLEAVQRVKTAGISLTVNITPNKYMEDGGLELIKLARKLNVNYAINSYLSEPRKGTGRDQVEHDMELDDYIQLYKRIKQLDNINLLPVRKEELPKVGGSTTSALRGFQCGGGRSSFSIIWSGKMQSCLTFSGIQIDLSKTNFTEAWKQIHQAVLEYPIPRECHGCAYEKLCTVCVARHATGAPLGHANPDLCRRAQRMICEGLAELG